MSEELDMEALGREWRKINMRTIELALETGKYRREFTWVFAYVTGMVLLFGYMLISLAFQTARPWGDRLPAIVTVGLCAAAVLWFFRRQWRAVQTADALLTGSSINLIDGRRALLDAELYTWESRAARSIELLVGPGAILGAGVLWWLGRVPPWLPLAMAYAPPGPDPRVRVGLRRDCAGFRGYVGRSPSWRSWRGRSNRAVYVARNVL